MFSCVEFNSHAQSHTHARTRKQANTHFSVYTWYTFTSKAFSQKMFANIIAIRLPSPPSIHLFHRSQYFLLHFSFWSFSFDLLWSCCDDLNWGFTDRLSISYMVCARCYTNSGPNLFNSMCRKFARKPQIDSFFFFLVPFLSLPPRSPAPCHCFVNNMAN